MNERELLKKIGELPQEIAPGRDPWDRIAARLDERDSVAGETSGGNRFRRWAWPVRAVAALAVLAVTVVLLSTPDSAVNEFEAPGQAATTGTASNVLPTVLASSEAEYLAAFREFIAVGDSREQISPLTVEKIETGWEDLRQVETALSDALAQNPEDPFLNRRLLQLRAKQLGFLRQLASLDNSNRRMTI